MVKAVVSEKSTIADSEKGTESAGSEISSRPKENLSDSIGERLQTLRNRYGLSQRELARRADVTNSSLSMIEQGKVSPSIGSLEKILHAFPISLQEFFSGSELAIDVVLPSEELVTIKKGKAYLTMFPLQATDSKMQMVKQEIPPAAKISSGWMTQAGFISGMLVSGHLRLTVDGVVHELKEGDAFQFSLNRQHEFENQSQDDSLLIGVVY